MPLRLHLRWSLWPALAAAAGIALTTWLGMWQYGRGEQKSILASRIEKLAQEPPISITARELDASDVELRQVEAHGTFEPRHAVFLDNRVRRGVVGYHVVMPLKLEQGARYVLVNRGWIAAGPERSQLPEVRTPPGPTVVRGRAVVPGRFLELSDEVTRGPVWQNLTLERYRKVMPIAIQPFVIQQDAAAAPDDGLIREWLPPDFGVEKHYGYSFQWFALSVLILVFYLATHVRRDRET